MKSIAILLFSALTAANGAWAQTSYQPPDGCLVLACEVFKLSPQDTCENPYYVKVDMCPGSETFNHLYSQRWFSLDFAYYVIDVPSAPHDTILEMSWTAIDTSYSALRTAFSNLESKFGTLVLRKDIPDRVDSSAQASRLYSVRFVNYVCVDSVLDYLDSFPDFESHPSFLSYPEELEYVPNDREDDTRN